MKLDECEETLFSIMAEMDGEPPPLDKEKTARHLSGCERCRTEIERQKVVFNSLQNQQRQSAGAIDLRLEIEKRIGDEPISEPAAGRRFFLTLGAMLIAYKLAEMLPAQDLGWLFKLAPLIFVAALFYFVKENPFKINTELKFEGELR